MNLTLYARVGFNQPFKFSALFKIYHKILKKFSQDCCEFLTKFLNNFYKKFTKFSQKTQRILTKSLQKFKKFKEFLRNSLNFPQNFQTLFTNSRKILKHFSQKTRKVLKQLSQNESKFPAKVRSTKKSLPKNLLCPLTKKSSLKKLYQKSSLVQKIRSKKLTQKPTARAALHTAGWCLPAPSRKSHFGLKCCILRNSRFPQQNPHLL